MLLSLLAYRPLLIMALEVQESLIGAGRLH
jgi:hypothetical protein